MSTISGRNLITDALTDLAVLGVGRPLSARDGALGLRYLQELIDSAELDPGVIYAAARTAYTLVASTENRTVGPSGNYVQARPLWLAGAFVKAVGSDLEIELDRLSRAEWLRIPDKTIEAELPSAIYLEPTITDATLHFYPVPTTAGTLILSTPTAVTGFSGTLDIDYTFPPGYQEWFRLKLRNKLARPFTKPLTEDMHEEERTAWRALERVNDPGPPRMVNDFPGGQGAAFDMTTGQYVARY
jgi:hypothetical protein